MVTLIILDGFGIGKNKEGNAILSAGTPNLNKLKKRYFYTELDASGTSVGLPEGQMGNSEVGHLTLGSGRRTWQDLMRINEDIKNGQFEKNKNLIKAISHALTNNSALHIMGLLSNGGVHSHINHLYAILDLAKKMGLKKVYVHAFLDGRDVPYNSSKTFIEDLEKHLNQTGYSLASICGRIYAMDRENRFERLEKAYNTLAFGENFTSNNVYDEINDSYKQGVFDEFMRPKLFDKNATIKDNDSVIFYNYRSDRARELSQSFTDENFNGFKTKKFKNLMFSTMEKYFDNCQNINIIYPPERIEDNLSAIISKNKMSQYHIAETTKYAHVTFFFNGGIEKPYKNETRKLIESIDTQDFSYYPKMRATEITENTLDAIASKKYDFVLVNYSNPDMIGHTGNFNATVEAIKFVEKQAYALALATIMAGGDCIITADHGNAEYMFDKNGNKITSHTSNKVPLIIATENYKNIKLKKNKSIAYVAPTILKMLNLPIPETMNESLF